MAFIDIIDVSIEFPGVKALNNVSFGIEEGQIVAICGENGAGKSTLAKIIAGVYAYGSYNGKIVYKGQENKFHSTLDAEKSGITIVHQELNQIFEMTVAENILLDCIPNKMGIVDDSLMLEKAKEFLKKVGLENIDPAMKIKELTVSKRQMIEIAKAIAKEPKVIVFDEATSSLTNNEIDILFRIMKELKKSGTTMIYVSHKLNEVFEICDSVVVLKDGCFINSADVENITKDDIVRWMVGRELKDMYPPRDSRNVFGEDMLKIENWCVYDNKNPNVKIVDNVSLSVKRGEILGIYGLMGAGRTELVESIFKGKAVKSTGNLKIKDKNVVLRNATDSVKYKIAFVTEDRKKTGLIMCSSIKNNISVASLNRFKKFMGYIDDDEENKASNGMKMKLNIKVNNLKTLVSLLSGGNQQKVVISKWLLTNPEILIMDEPTRGIDVGTKSEIYKILRDLANQGIAIIMVSSELPEILGISDRIVVMKDGKINGEVDIEMASEEVLLKYAMEV